VADSELAQYRQQFKDAANQARLLTSGLTEAQFNWRPAPDRWSIEECLAHLTIVGLMELDALERAIEDGRRKGITGTGPFQYGSIERFILGMTEPPLRTRLSSPRRFIPVHGQPLTAILPTFSHLQSHLILQTENAEGLHLERVRVPTPVFRYFKMSLGMTFAVIAAHQRRHLQQARVVWESLPALPPVEDSRAAVYTR
jgi:hypothetical protein